MKTLLIGNWKQNIGPEEAGKFCQTYKELTKEKHIHKRIETAIAAPYITIPYTGELPSYIFRAGQNCSEFRLGAHTGEIDASWLKSVGCKYCIIGHSERRKLNNETDDMVFNKYRNLIACEIEPILCIGDVSKDGSPDERIQAILSQLRFYSQETSLWIAYEPVWAIGSGEVPTYEWINTVTDEIHRLLPNSRVLYGGSVNEKNAADIMANTHIRGLLIGGASLDAKKLYTLERNVEDKLYGRR
ncbi:MAG: triose-phosphate isomerase [Caldisericia bacterium]|nr:triose-phosphate isomerase [Caldisericia bacterium]